MDQVVKPSARGLQGSDPAEADFHPADFEEVRVLVVGDLMLDVYLEGAVSRVSPEAPVPVVHQRAVRHVPGGAANVAANISALGGKTRLVGLVGADEAGQTLLDLLRNFADVDVSYVVSSSTRPTTAKTRVMSGRHQLLRIDNEDARAATGADCAQMIERIDQAIAWADVVLISDYAKGVCANAVIAHAIKRATDLGKPSIVDPKQRDMTVYAGATVIKPNRAELSASAGLPVGNDRECEAAAKVVIAQTGSAIMVTRSEQGMSYFGADNHVLHLPTFAKEVFDVSGAGDTVAATLALGFGSKMSLLQTMRCANHAAGVVVSKSGTATVTRAELAAAMHLDGHASHSKRGRLVSLAEAVRVREIWRQMELTVGFANGCFDLLHPGHVTLLENSAAQCDRLIVALNTDASVQRLKGPSRPVQSEAARARVMGALECVDLVILFDEDTPLEAITALRPDIIIKGSDYTEDKVVGGDFVKSYGGKVVLIDLVEGHSTTRLIDNANSA